MSKKGVILCGHGSKSKEANNAFLSLYNKLSKKFTDLCWSYGFLEHLKPDYESAFLELLNSGVREIVALPVFMFTGKHIQEDLPEIFSRLLAENEGVILKIAQPVGISDELIEISEKRIKKIEKEYGRISPSESVLLVVGVGASVNKANEDFAVLSQSIRRKTGYRLHYHAFISKQAEPGLEQIVDYIETLPQKIIVVLPVILFPGVYVDMILEIMNNLRSRSSKEIIMADTFGSDDSMIKILSERMEEAYKS